MEAQPEKPTILDILNEDCWRAVLNYVSTEDLVRSERVSRRWQNIVYLYLQGVRFAVREPWRGAERGGSRRVLAVDASTDPGWYERVLNKWGLNVVSVVYDYNAFRSNEAILSGLAEMCPYLESITFSHLCHHFMSCDWASSFTTLKRVSFRSCSSTGDCCVRRLLETNAIEELGIDMSDSVTGSCLAGARNLTALKSLFLREFDLDIDCLISAADRLTSVTKLELLHMSDEVYRRIYLVLDRMPQLEHLTLVWEEEIELGGELVESVGRLGRLRTLDLCLNPNVTDDWLAILARGCKDLRSVTLNNCKRVTPGGLAAFCRAAPALEELCVAAHIRTTDAYALAFVKASPTLTTLDLRDCRQVSCLMPLLAAVARARFAPASVSASAHAPAYVSASAHAPASASASAPAPARAPLRLRLAGTAAARNEHRQTRYPGLILDYS